MRLVNRSALVTGAARGIGRSIVDAFRSEGANVVGFDLDNESAGASDAGPAGPGALTTVSGNVTDRDDVEGAVSAVLDRYGRLDIAVCNAGLFRAMPFLDLDDETWRLHLDVLLTGVFYTAQAAARAMSKTGGGSIVVTTSVNAESASVGAGHYSAAKAGALMLAQSMAWELGPLGIRVNSVAPGCVDTRLSSVIFSDPVRRADVESKIPLRRTAEPADIASAVVFLASDDSSYITGTSLRVDGGLAAGWILDGSNRPQDQVAGKVKVH